MQRLFSFFLGLTTMVPFFGYAQDPADVVNFDIRGNAYSHLPNPPNNTSGINDWFQDIVNFPNAGFGFIDTAGTAALLEQFDLEDGTLDGIYGDNIDQHTFFQRLAPGFTQNQILNGASGTYILVDALAVRDHHGGGSPGPEFSMINSSGAKIFNNPNAWIGGNGSASPDILDVYAAGFRDGPDANSDLWLMGGISFIDDGSDFPFDFELLRSNFEWDTPEGVPNNADYTTNYPFKSEGPEEGRTAWLFDASGNIIRPGDISLSFFVDNSNSGSVITAEVWVWLTEADYQTYIVPATPPTNDFDFTGDWVQISGVTAGYARIALPGSAYFYDVNQVLTPAAPWGHLEGGALFRENFSEQSFFEFAINLAAINADPAQAGNFSESAFSNLFVKTRSSASFTSDMKDFVRPLSFLDVIMDPNAPFASDSEITVVQGSEDNSLGLAPPSDPNNLPLTITVTELPNVGIVTKADGTPLTVGDILTEAELITLVYDPPVMWDGSVIGQFEYQVSNGVYSDAFGTTNIMILVETCNPDGFAAFYPLDDFANDVSGNDHNPTNTPSLTYFPNDKKQGSHSGQRNSAGIQLNDGTSGTGVFLGESYSNFSISMWVKPSVTNVAQTLFEFGGWSGSRPAGMGLRITSTGQIQASIGNDSSQGTNSVTSSSTITPNEWHHVAMVYDGAQLTVYLDGMATSVTEGTPPDPTAGITGGGGLFETFGTDVFGATSTGPYTGLMDDVAIYFSPLSASEINDIVACGAFSAQIAQVCDGSEATTLYVNAKGAPSGQWQVFNLSTNTVVGGPFDNGDFVEINSVIGAGQFIQVRDVLDNSLLAEFTNIVGGGNNFVTADDDGQPDFSCDAELACNGELFDLIAQGYAGEFSNANPGGILGAYTLAGPHNGNFNAVIFGSFISDGTGDSEGRLAVEGNFTASGTYTVGGGAPSSTGGLNAPFGWDNLVVGGDMDYPVANAVRGNVLYNNNVGASLPGFIGIGSASGMHRNYLPDVNWGSAQAYFQGLSNDYNPANISTTCSAYTSGTVTDNGGGSYALNAAGATGVVVFDLSGQTMPSAPSFDFQNIGNVSAILVLYPGATVTFTGGSISIDGITATKPYTDPAEVNLIEKALWNFYEATTFNFSAYAILGGALAPFTNTVTLNGGEINGQAIFSGDVSQSNGFEFHNFCFNGDFSSCFITYDWGDLPDGPYPTDATDGGEGIGPGHIIVDNLQIGATIDNELDGQPSANADGDDINGDDEDGVDFTNVTFQAGNTVNIPIVLTNKTGVDATLYAFIDWNNDGDFGDTGEAVTLIVNTAVGAQTLLVPFTIPAEADGTAINITTGARFRLTTDTLTGNTWEGAASDGEVEDYLISISCPTGNCLGVDITTINNN